MWSVYALKPAFQNLLRPLVARTAAAGITANAITIAATLGSMAVALELAYGPRWWIVLPVFLFVRMAMNAMDGMLAREYGQQSRMGAVLNEAGDIVSDAVLALPFAYLPGWGFAAGAAALFAALTELAGLAGKRRYAGPFGKSDRAVAMGAAACWLALGWQLAPWAAWLWIALCCLTIWNRLRSVGP